MNGSGSMLGRLRRWLGAAVVLMGALFWAGCGAANAEAAFAADFNCNTAVASETNAVGRYRVHGCGREATYLCVGRTQEVCGIQTVNEGRSSESSRDEDDDRR